MKVDPAFWGGKAPIFDAADYLTDAWINREAHELGLAPGLNRFLNGDIHAQAPGTPGHHHFIDMETNGLLESLQLFMVFSSSHAAADPGTSNG